MRNKIENLIRKTAENNISTKYNLAQYKEGGKKHNEKKMALLHKSVCEQIVQFANAHPQIPFYFILSVGISKGAYKESEFNKGYKNFDAEKVFIVYTMGQEYNKYNGIPNKKMSDVTIRLIMRYYEKKSQTMDDFIQDLNKSKVFGKNCGSRDIDYAILCKNLNIPFKDNEDNATLVDAA